MSYLSIFKRIIPFFLTFAAGLLIASLFVPIGAPNFPNADRGGKGRFRTECSREKESLRRENDRLRQELDAMRLELDAVKAQTLDFTLPNADVPPPPSHPRVVIR